MNDRRFIELLNLYVDQELSEAEARELEQEIARHPERRQVYGQYCRMQRACVRLLDQQAAPAPQIDVLTQAAATGTADADEPVVLKIPAWMAEPAPRRRRRSWAAWSGGALAAAACFAVVAIQSFHRGQLDGTTMAQSDAPEAVSVAASPVPRAEQMASVATPNDSAASAVARSAYRPVFVVNLRPDPEQLANEAPSLALEQPSLNWLQELRLQPIRRVPVDTWQFDAANGLRSQTPPSLLTDRQSQQPASEMVTFTFQR
jgi:anti-sigma factor RsiW